MSAAARKALLSVSHHVNYGFDPVPGAVPPQAFEKAIDTLTELDDPRAPGRRRWMLVQMASAGLTQPELLSASVGPERAERIRSSQARLAESVGVDPGALDRAVEEDFESPPEGGDDRSAIVGVVEESISETSGAWPIGLPDCWACIGGTPRRVRGTAVSKVGVSLEQLRPLMDPQAWDDWGDVFVATYKLIEDPVNSGNWVQDPNPPPVGTAWDGLVYEHVIAGIGQFENHLVVDYQVMDDGAGNLTELRVDYSLADSRSATILGITGSGVLAWDFGHIRAVPIQDGVEISVVKTLRFHEHLMNTGVVAILCDWVADSSQVGPPG